ncbi:sodium/glutamate symporter [Oceanicoccus sagamiensis]|uniref:Sodium/glutamate symporter n=1 Tax=Oceanicoccus sagamiensis TaxID=716816 RepID=A0A1X9NFD9_9GAMM|nr:sodium/glutamate symporter [Oceanicoccus sagamiensis]ARN75754.1 sodium/glutamate symporter [Oceanicoccus sagamiensis]
MEQQYLVEGANLVIASVLLLATGRYLNTKIDLLSRLNIPMAVTGGLLCSSLLTILYLYFNIRVDFDLELRNLLLLTFFSTIGLSAKLSVMASGGRTLVLLLCFAIVLLIFQDIAGIGIALAFDVNPAYGLFAGSISFAGGHGTSIAWGTAAEEAGLAGAGTLGIACATFGLVAGGLIGGPMGGYMIKKHGLASQHTVPQHYESIAEAADEDPEYPLENAFSTLLVLALCVGLGHNLNDWLIIQGVALPQFLTAMLIGIVITNIIDYCKFNLHTHSINRSGEISLHLFLAMSLMSVQLWTLANSIGLLLLVLIVQMMIIVLLAVYVVFRFVGKDYDAAIIASGFMGLGLGATPVAMANMQALTARYGPSTKAFIVVPMIGAFFIDLSNAVVINLFSSLPMMGDGF